VLFVRLPLFPMQPRKEKKPNKPKRAQPLKADKKSTQQERPRQETLALIKRLVKAGLAALKVFFKHLRITGVQLVLPVYAGDAADTATRCGQLQAVIGGARAVLQGRLKVHYKRLELIPDFADQFSDQMLVACKLKFSPGIVFVMGIVFLRQFLASKKRRYSRKVIRAAKRRRKAAAKRNGTHRPASQPANTIKK